MKTECVKIFVFIIVIIVSKFCGFFVSFFLCRFLDPGVFIFCAQTQTTMIFLFYLFQSILFVYFFDRFLGKKTRNGLYRSSLFSRS